jgi:glyoxylase-like metal-dependent hydrolase (beta-lactamase superfamily II)
MNKQVLISVHLGAVTAYLVKGSQTVLIDTGNPGSAAKILKKARENGIDPKQISLIILTHGHSDHAGAAAALRKETGAAIAAHQEEAEALKRGTNLHLRPTGLSGRIFRILIRDREKGSAGGVEPDLIINKEMDLKPFGVKGKVIATPGHTPGSVSVFLDGGGAVVGDLLMGGFALRRVPRYPLFAYDLKRVERSLRLLIKLKPGIIYASHGGPFKPEAVTKKFFRNKKEKSRPRRAKK